NRAERTGVRAAHRAIPQAASAPDSASWESRPRKYRHRQSSAPIAADCHTSWQSGAEAVRRAGAERHLNLYRTRLRRGFECGKRRIVAEVVLWWFVLEGATSPFAAGYYRLEHAVNTSLYARAFDRHGWRECTHCRSKCTPSMKRTVPGGSAHRQTYLGSASRSARKPWTITITWTKP